MIPLAFDLGNEFDANFTLIVGAIATLAIAVVVVRIILFYLFGSPPPSNEPRPVRSATLPPSTTKDEGGGSQSSPTEPKSAQVECQRMRNKALSAFRPRNTDWKGRYWRRICEQIAKGERLPEVNLVEFVQTMDVDTQHVMRDLLALSGEIDLFLRFLELNPGLNTTSFRKKMIRLYTRLLAEVDGREVERRVLLQRFKDAVQLEKPVRV